MVSYFFSFGPPIVQFCRLYANIILYPCGNYTNPLFTNIIPIGLIAGRFLAQAGAGELWEIFCLSNNAQCCN